MKECRCCDSYPNISGNKLSQTSPTNELNASVGCPRSTPYPLNNTTDYLIFTSNINQINFLNLATNRFWTFALLCLINIIILELLEKKKRVKVLFLWTTYTSYKRFNLYQKTLFYSWLRQILF